MNKKTILLTASLVSLFLGITFLVLGNTSRLLFAFGGLIFAIGLVIYLFFKRYQTNEIILSLSSETIKEAEEQMEVINSVKKLKSRQIWTSVYMGILAFIIIMAVIVSQFYH